MSYAFPKDAKDGDKVKLDNGVEYIYQTDKDRWMVNAIDGEAGAGASGIRAKHLFQLRGGFTLTADNKADVGLVQPRESTTRDFYDDLEYAGYPGVYHLSEGNQDEDYTPAIVEYLLFTGRGSFKENTGDGDWVSSGVNIVKPDIDVGDIVTVRVRSGYPDDHSSDDTRFTTGFLTKLEHRWRVTEVIECIDSVDGDDDWANEWQCVKVERIERDNLYWGEHRYSERSRGFVDVSVQEGAVEEVDPCIKCTAVVKSSTLNNNDPQIVLDYMSMQNITIMTLRGFDEYPPEDVTELTLNGNVHKVDKVVWGNKNHDYWFAEEEGDLKTPYIGNELTVEHCPKPIEYATLEHSDGRDDALAIRIDELEQEIDIIAPRLDGAQYKYASSYSVKPGEMFIASNSFTAANDVVFFNDVALDGTTHAWGSLHEGDYLEITDTNQKSRTAENYAMYLCTKEPEGQGLKQIEVALVKGSGAPTVGDVLDAKGFELGGNDINDLDSRYDLKQSHLKQYRTMKVIRKHYDYRNYWEIPATANALSMTYTSFVSTSAFITKDLDAWYPPDKYDFVPGFVTVLEHYVGSGRGWEIEPPVVVWVFWAADVKEWSPTRQRIQGQSIFGGNAENSNEYPTTDRDYQVNFQCFRRK